MKLNIVISIIVAITSLSYIIDLEYKVVASGELKILLPKNFSKAPIKPVNDASFDQPMNVDLYCNKDTSEKIVFTKLDKADIQTWAHFLTIGILRQSTKTYSTTTKSINGNQVYLVKFELNDGRKSTYNEMFLLNTKNSTIWGLISCDQKSKNEWMPISDRIINSIKLN